MVNVKEGSRQSTSTRTSSTRRGERMIRVQPTIEMTGSNNNNSKTNNSSAAGYLNLKPLRELDKNFDVDIASCLEEYLKELCLVQKLDQEDEGTSSEISHLQSQLQKASADTSANNWNFTNAAILLQNSSSVYSRKVEYLHSLVYQTLHRLSDNSATNGNGKDKHKKKHDVDIQEFEAFDPNSYFLVFEEDTLPIDLDGKSIDLHQDAAASSHHHGINIQDMEHAQNSHATPLNINLNMNTNMNQTRLSLDRTAIESITKNKSTIRSHAGQQLIRSILEGSQGRNANMGGNGGGGMHGMRGAEGQAVLRLMNGVCDVSDSGALLLPGTGIGIHTRNIGGDNGDGSTQERLDMDVEDYRHGYGVHHNDGAPAAAGEGGPVQFDQGQGYDDDNDDDNNDGAGFELHSPYPRPSMHPDEMIATNAHGTTAGNGANAIAIANTIHQKKDSTTSPWDLLDPHDASESKSRPLRKAITFCLPHGVQLPPSALVTGARTKKIPRARVKNNQHDEDDYEHSLGDGAGSSLAVREHRAALQKMEASSHDDDDMDMDMDTSISNKKQKMVPLPIQPLAFGDEFLYVLQSQQRQRAAEKRRIKKIQRLRQQEAIGMHSNSNRGMDANERFDDMYDDNDEDDVDGQAFDFAGGDYDNGDGGDDNDHHHDLGDDDNVFDRVFARDINANGDGTAGQGAECKTFEELCRQHLKEFAKGAERFAVETHLSKRVENWQMKLEVVLAEEEERPEFDIQLYGNRIMASAQDCLQKEKVSEIGGLSSDTVEFVSITREKEPFEVCRTFLASLMLCNSENVVFTNTAIEPNEDENKNGDDMGSDSDNADVSSPHDLFLKIINYDMASPMDAYLAPSIASPNKNVGNDISPLSSSGKSLTA